MAASLDLHNAHLLKPFVGPEMALEQTQCFPVVRSLSQLVVVSLVGSAHSAHHGVGTHFEIDVSMVPVVLNPCNQ